MNLSNITKAGNVAKVADKAAEVAKVADKAAEVAKTADKVADAAKVAREADVLKLTDKAADAAKAKAAVMAEVAADTAKEAPKSSLKTIERVQAKSLSSLPVVKESEIGGLAGAFKRWVAPNPPQDLMQAVEWRGNDAVSKILSQNKLDVNFVNEAGDTPLYQAVKRAVDDGDPSFVKTLLNAGADPNLGSHSPLSAALKGNRADVVDLLKQSGALHSDSDIYNAIKSCHYADAKSLLAEVGKDGKVLEQASPALRKEAAEIALHSGDPGLMQSLFGTDLVPKGSVNLNAIDQQGHAVLHKLAFDGTADGDTVSALTNAGANLSIPDPQGRTPLFWAAARGQKDTVKALLDAGADPNIPDRLGYNALGVAKDRGQTDIADMLTQAGAKSLDQGASKTLSFNDKAVNLFNEELLFGRSKPGFLKELEQQRYLGVYGSPEAMKEGHALINSWRTNGQSELRSALKDVLNGKEPGNQTEKMMEDMLATRKERWDKLSQATGIKTPESFELYRGVGGKDFVNLVADAWKDETTYAVTLPHHTLMSWSTDRSLAERFANSTGKDASIILKKDVPFDMTWADMYVDAGPFLDESSVTGNVLQNEVVVATKNPDSLTIPKEGITVNYQGKTYSYAQRQDLFNAMGK